jgi:hypothetical protein
MVVTDTAHRGAHVRSRHHRAAATITAAAGIIALATVTGTAPVAAADTGVLILQPVDANGNVLDTTVDAEALASGCDAIPAVPGETALKVTNDTDEPITVYVGASTCTQNQPQDRDPGINVEIVSRGEVYTVLDVELPTSVNFPRG